MVFCFFLHLIAMHVHFWPEGGNICCPSHISLSFHPIKKVREKVLGEALHLFHKSCCSPLPYLHQNRGFLRSPTQPLISLISTYTVCGEDRVHMGNFSLWLQLPRDSIHTCRSTVWSNSSEILAEFSWTACVGFSIYSRKEIAHILLLLPEECFSLDCELVDCSTTSALW